MQSKISIFAQITSIAGFALSIIIGTICGIFYIKDSITFLDKRLTVVETNYTHIPDALNKINGDLDKMKDSIDKIYFLMPKSKKDAILIE